MALEETLSEIERFCERAAEVEGVEAYPEQLKPAAETDVAALAEKFGLTIPEDIRQFWRRGLKYQSLSIGGSDGGFAAAGFDWCSMKTLNRDLPMFRDLAQHYDAGSDERRLMEQGFQLTYSEPQLMWDPRGGITHFATRNDLQPPIAPSLTEFLEHWLEAGCFSSHAVTKWLPKVQHLVPGRIPPEKNLWIGYYKRVFAEYA